MLSPPKTKLSTFKYLLNKTRYYPVTWMVFFICVFSLQTLNLDKNIAVGHKFASIPLKSATM